MKRQGAVPHRKVSDNVSQHSPPLSLHLPCSEPKTPSINQHIQINPRELEIELGALIILDGQVSYFPCWCWWHCATQSYFEILLLLLVSQIRLPANKIESQLNSLLQK